MTLLQQESKLQEIIQLVGEGTFGEDQVHAAWPDIVAGSVSGRENNEEIIVYIALGIWGEYAAILPQVYQRAITLGIGQNLPCSH